jgi:hypothetical protein
MTALSFQNKYFHKSLEKHCDGRNERGLASSTLQSKPGRVPCDVVSYMPLYCWGLPW